MLSLILAESAIETIPKGFSTRSINSSQSKHGKRKSKFSLLLRSYHNNEMMHLKENWKRGRPDIVHFSLLQALGSPLNYSRLLKTYVHTIQDYVISVAPETRLPRNYLRFIGLIEQLFEYGRVPKEGNKLLYLQRKNFNELLNEVKPSYTVAFSRCGRLERLEDLVARLSDHENLAVIIGGFPKGHFKDETVSQIDDVVSIDDYKLDAWTVVGRVIYEYERAICLSKKIF